MLDFGPLKKKESTSVKEPPKQRYIGQNSTKSPKISTRKNLFGLHHWRHIGSKTKGPSSPRECAALEATYRMAWVPNEPRYRSTKSFMVILRTSSVLQRPITLRVL